MSGEQERKWMVRVEWYPSPKRWTGLPTDIIRELTIEEAEEVAERYRNLKTTKSVSIEPNRGREENVG